MRPRQLSGALAFVVALAVALLTFAAPAVAPTIVAGSGTATDYGLASAKAATAKVVAKFQTDAVTAAYRTATSTKVLVKIPADYTVAAASVTKKHGRLKVTYRSKSVWVKAAKVDRVKKSTDLGKLSWAGSAKKNIAKWCGGVPVTAKKNSRNYASASYHGSDVTEKIRFSTTTPWGTKLDPNHPMALAIQYHECGHILQYRAYDYDFAGLDKAMDKVYGPDGTEHMADCIADVLGAERKGKYVEKDGTRLTYVAGYGGKCTKAQKKAAKRMIAGKRA